MFQAKSWPRAGCQGTGLQKGEMDQEEGEALEEVEMAEGFVLVCIAYAASDCTIHTHREAELYGRE